MKKFDEKWKKIGQWNKITDIFLWYFLIWFLIFFDLIIDIFWYCFHLLWSLIECCVFVLFIIKTIILSFVSCNFSLGCLSNFNCDFSFTKLFRIYVANYIMIQTKILISNELGSHLSLDKKSTKCSLCHPWLTLTV